MAGKNPVKTLVIIAIALLILAASIAYAQQVSLNTSHVLRLFPVFLVRRRVM